LTSSRFFKYFFLDKEGYSLDVLEEDARIKTSVDYNHDLERIYA
jgi:hypothetical protein